jgi:hypothetical protein
MKLTEAKELIDKLAEQWPDQDVRITLPLSAPQRKMADDIRGMGFFTHWEGSAHAQAELVVKDRYDGDIRPSRDEASPS